MELIKISNIQQEKQNIQVSVITDTYKCKKEEIEKFCKMVVKYTINEWINENETTEITDNGEVIHNIAVFPFNPKGKPIKIIV